MMSKIAIVLFMSLILSSCFNLPLSSKGKLSDDAGLANITQQAVSNTISDTKAIATIDPNSRAAVALVAPKVQGLSGASVIVPPGSLGISADIVVEQATDFGQTSLTSEMGLANDIQVASASPGMIIRPTENVDLKKPLSLAMPLPTLPGLRLAETGSKYAIFYKYFDPTQAQLVTGFKVVDGVNVKLAIDDATGRDVMKFDGYFGAYWATILSREVKPAEVPAPVAASEPIVNKANVPVVETKGIVKETDIVQKQAIPEIVWTKPTMQFDAINRAVTATALVPAGRTVTACKADLYEAVTLPSGISLDLPAGPTVTFNIVKTTAHSLVARFRCTDDQGRIAVTPWTESVAIPAVAAPGNTATAGSNAMCNPNKPAVLETRYYVNGVLTPTQTLTSLGNCRYSADIYSEKNNSFYIAKSDSSYVCGLAGHNLAEGPQVLTCEKATAANLGSNFFQSMIGNFTLTLDFSKSETAPVATMTRIPCGTISDLYAVFVTGYFSTGMPPIFPTPTPADKMVHLGACEFLYNTASLPVTGMGAAMQFRTLDGSFSCGDSNPGAFAGTFVSGHEARNVCSSGNRFFLVGYQDPGITSNRLSVRIGPSAQAHSPGDIASNDIVRFDSSSHCPDDLYLYSTVAGTTAARYNHANRESACSYNFQFFADDADASHYDFKIGSMDKSLLCGSAMGGSGSWTMTCDAPGNISPAMQLSTPVLGMLYKISVSGDGTTGNLTYAYSSYSQPACANGVYLDDAVNNGFTNKTANAFAEVGNCVFEKYWTPTAAGQGFYLHSGQGVKICGSDNSPTQPSINGGVAAVPCTGSLIGSSGLSQIKPLNIVPGTKYKITADFRYADFEGRIKVETAAAGTCADDVYISGGGALPSAPTKMAFLGNCLYSYDWMLPPNSMGNTNLVISAGGQLCEDSSAMSGGINFPTGGMSYGTRSANMVCGTANGNTTPIYPTTNRTYRTYVKRNPNDNTLIATFQDMSPSTQASSFVDATGHDLGTVNMANVQCPLGGMCYGMPNSSLWSPAANASGFLVQTNPVGVEGNYCALDAAASPPALGGSPVNLLCNVSLAALPNARKITGSYNASGKYWLDVVAPTSFELPFQVKVAVAYGFGGPAVPSFINGSTSFDAMPAGVNTPYASGAGASPGAVDRASSAIDANGNLWQFGGANGAAQMNNHLWYFDVASNLWILASGDLNQFNDYGDVIHPSARHSAAVWIDNTTHKFYLYGGLGYGTSGVVGDLHDFWSYDLITHAWVHISGDQALDQGSASGDLGVSSLAYNPGSRRFATTWSNGTQHYLFGGFKGVSNAVFNDIWMFDSSLNEWALVGGQAETALTPASDQIGARERAVAWAIPGSPNVYLYGGDANGLSSQELWLLNTTNMSWTRKRGDDSQKQNQMAITNRLYHEANNPSYGNDANTISSAGLSAKGELWLREGAHFWAYHPTLNQWALVLSDGATQSSYETVYTGTPYISNRSNPTVWGLTNLMWLNGGLDYAMGSNWRNDLWRVDFPTSNAP